MTLKTLLQSKGSVVVSRITSEWAPVLFKVTTVCLRKRHAGPNEEVNVPVGVIERSAPVVSPRRTTLRVVIIVVAMPPGLRFGLVPREGVGPGAGKGISERVVVRRP